MYLGTIIGKYGEIAQQILNWVMIANQPSHISKSIGRPKIGYLNCFSSQCSFMDQTAKQQMTNM